jgi:ferredoxin--NADP+ reductase
MAMLRVAVVGAGPAGFFATAELLRHTELQPQVDMFDRLPTPYGLVRNGVAPDHQSIKAIAGKYAKEADAGGSRFRLFGNVEVGKDLSIAELAERYHAIIFAFGAQSNRRLGIPGEELRGVHPASVFVGWYNGYPDCRDARYDLSGERAVVVGVGNVGLDVARILVKPQEELRKTDIADHALRQLAASRIREVYLLGRQSQAQATYTTPELEELTKIPGCDLVVADEDRELDAGSLSQLAAGALEPRVRKNVQVVSEKALREPVPGRKAVVLRYFVSPLAIVGDERVRAIRLQHNRLVLRDGVLEIEPAGTTEDLPCEIVFRAVGYKVVPLAGVPMDDKAGTVAHVKGQVVGSDGRKLAGMFVTGWAKRGPQGVIGTNKPDATETVESLLSALAAGELAEPPLSVETADVERLLVEHGVAYVSFSDWKLLDQLEVAAGREDGRPRRKFTDVASMLKALGDAKMSSLSSDLLVGKES